MEPGAPRRLTAAAAADTLAVGFASPWWWRRAVTVVAWIAVAGVMAGSLATAIAVRPETSTAVAAGLNVAAGLLILLARRRWPRAVLAAVVAVAVCTTVLTTTFPGHGSIVLVVLAIYNVASVELPRSSITLTVCAEASIGAFAFVGDRPLVADLGSLVSEVAFLSCAVAVGISVRYQRSMLQGLRERAEHAEREQLWGAARAVAEERVRIARELHDVVAHHVSLLVVQAGAVRENLPTEHPTRPVLDAMIEGGRSAMAELREMLGALRVAEAQAPEPAGAQPSVAPDSEAPRSPQPALGQLASLVDRARAAGLPVTLHEDWREEVVPPVVSLSVYRIVQEALTNVIKHAPGAFTRVVVEVRQGFLTLSVRNGPAPSVGDPEVRRSDPARGHGLVGMAERATLAHGSLQAGPLDTQPATGTTTALASAPASATASRQTSNAGLATNSPTRSADSDTSTGRHGWEVLASFPLSSGADRD